LPEADVIELYDSILLGFPSGGTIPMPVWTFLEAYDFSGKRLFVLHPQTQFRGASGLKDRCKTLPVSTVDAMMSSHVGQRVVGSEGEVKAAQSIGTDETMWTGHLVLIAWLCFAVR
jgi:hypothetical protein